MKSVNFELEVHESNRNNSIAKKELGKTGCKYNLWRFKKSLHFAIRKGTETLSDSFSTLAWTLRLQPATKGPHWITLRLESMMMCSNHFGKRILKHLGKDCCWDDSVRLHFLIHNGRYPRKRWRPRPRLLIRPWGMKHDAVMRFPLRTTLFADCLPHPHPWSQLLLAKGRFNRDVFFTGYRKRQWGYRTWVVWKYRCVPGRPKVSYRGVCLWMLPQASKDWRTGWSTIKGNGGPGIL